MAWISKKTVFIQILVFVIFFNSIGTTFAAVNLPVSESLTSKYIYRFWSPVFKGHFFTMDYDEANRVANYDSNWNFEQIAFSAFALQTEGTVPVYRFWSPVFKGHFYTTSAEEWMRVKDTDPNWTYEWIAYYTYPASNTGEAATVYRFWSPVFKHHFFTIDEEEMKRVRDTDPNWTYEGIAYKVPLDDTNQQIIGAEDELLEGDTAAIQIDEFKDITTDYPTQVKTGEKLIAVKVYLLNTGAELLNYSLNDFILKDPLTGQTYQPQPLAEPALISGTLAPDESIEGYLTFAIPNDLNEFEIEYANEAMQVKNNSIDIKLNATPSVVIISNGVIIDQFSGKKIVGKVKNNTTDQVRHVKITADFYNQSMNKISTDFSYAEGTDIDYLKPGDTAEFRIWYDADPAVIYYELSLDWETS
jgi:hypothetical protein